MLTAIDTFTHTLYIYIYINIFGIYYISSDYRFDGYAQWVAGGGEI